MDLIRTLDDRVALFERNGTQVLGIRLASSRNHRALTMASKRNKEELGWVFRNGNIQPWQTEGVAEFEGSTYVYGPPLEGTTLGSRLSGDFTLTDCRTLADGLSRIEEKGDYELHGHRVLLLDGGGVFFLPPSLGEILSNLMTETEKLTHLVPLTHPEVKRERAISFQLAVLGYRALTGGLPYGGGEAETHTAMRAGRALSARQVDIHIADEVDGVLSEALGIGTGTCVFHSDDDWADRFEAWERDGVRGSFSEPELTRRQKEARRAEETIERRTKTETFLRTKRVPVLIAAAALVVVVGVTWGFVRQASKPPINAGMSARETLQFYYHSYNDLNLESMEAVLARGVAKADRDWVSQTYVISRVRQAYEATSSYFSISDWRAAGQPEIRKDDVIYGVAKLKVLDWREDDTSAQGIILFERWIPNPDLPLRPDGGLNSEGKQVEVRAELVKTKREVWKITKLEELSTDPLGALF